MSPSAMRSRGLRPLINQEGTDSWHKLYHGPSLHWYIWLVGFGGGFYGFGGDGFAVHRVPYIGYVGEYEGDGYGYPAHYLEGEE